MKELLKKYYKMNDEEKEELEDLYLLHELQMQISEHEDLDLTLSDEEIIFEATRFCLLYSNISGSEIISRLLDLLECRDVTIEDIDNCEIDDLIELLDRNVGDFKDFKPKDEIITEFRYEGYYCVLMTNADRYIIVYDKDNKTNVAVYNNLEEIIAYVIKNRLLNEEKDIV